MATKPENQYISAVHKGLPSKEVLYREKMHNPFSSGTADWWYSGDLADLWVEYKFLAALPKRDNTSILAELSPLQKDWLEGRHREGRNVAVVIGSPEGAVVLRFPDWLKPTPRFIFIRDALTKRQIAEWIQLETLGRICAI